MTNWTAQFDEHSDAWRQRQGLPPVDRRPKQTPAGLKAQVNAGDVSLVGLGSGEPTEV